MSLHQNTTDQLWRLRTDLIDIKKEDLSSERLEACIVEHQSGLYQAYNLVMGVHLYGSAKARIDAYKTTDVDVLDEVRCSIVLEIDDLIRVVGGSVPMRSILDVRILKVKDIKLSTLLNEFNRAKDQPNLALIGLRTIVGLIIHERAKQKYPDHKLAKKEDLDLSADARTALAEKIFDSAESKYLKDYIEHFEKSIADVIAHKVGDAHLAREGNLDKAVEVLDRLLPSII